MKIIFTKSAFVLLAAISLTANKSNAQATAQNVFIEAGGPGLTFSLNYDTRLNSKRDGIGVRAGIGYLSVDDFSLLSIPLQINYLSGQNGHYFEAGAGATFLRLHSNPDNFLFGNGPGVFIGSATLGYRYQPLNSGFNFRANVDPIFDLHNFDPFWFGISVGYTIK